MGDDDQTTTKTKILSVLEHIEERLEEYKDIPEEVKQLRILQTQLHAALKTKQAQEERLGDIAYRILTTAISLLFPHNGKHK
jgi:hypothetical protein